MVFHTSGKREKLEIAMLVSDKIDFKPRLLIGDELSHYIMIKNSVH